MDIHSIGEYKKDIHCHQKFFYPIIFLFSIVNKYDIL